MRRASPRGALRKRIVALCRVLLHACRVRHTCVGPPLIFSQATCQDSASHSHSCVHCACARVCMCTSVHPHMWTCVHVRMSLEYLCTCVHVHLSVCTCTKMHEDTPTSMSTPTRPSAYLSMLAFMYKHIHTHAHVHIHVHKYVLTNGHVGEAPAWPHATVLVVAACDRPPFRERPRVVFVRWARSGQKSWHTACVRCPRRSVRFDGRRGACVASARE